MSTVIRSLRQHMREKSGIFYRYNRSHPRFKWFIAIDALLSVTLVLGGLAVASQTFGKPHTEMLARSGAVSLSAKELIEVVRREKIVAYWLGPISGSRYTIVATTPGVAVITYLFNGKGIGNSFQKNLVIETDLGPARSDELNDPSEEVSNHNDTTVTGNMLTYSSEATDHSHISVAGEPHFISIYYPTDRSALTLETDAEAIFRIS